MASPFSRATGHEASWPPTSREGRPFRQPRSRSARLRRVRRMLMFVLSDARGRSPSSSRSAESTRWPCWMAIVRPTTRMRLSPGSPVRAPSAMVGPNRLLGCSDAAPESLLKGRGLDVRAAIVSTYPPRACGIGTFAADVRGALLGVDGIDRVEKVVIVNEPSRPQRPGLVATIAPGEYGETTFARRGSWAGSMWTSSCCRHEYGIFGGRDTASTSPR